jgi:hypothetical protein
VVGGSCVPCAGMLRTCKSIVSITRIIHMFGECNKLSGNCRWRGGLQCYLPSDARMQSYECLA